MANTTVKPNHSPVKTKKSTQFLYTIETWKQSDAHALYQLEKKCWAPWLRKSEEDFKTIATNFSSLQRLIRNKNGAIVAFMSVNRINWDGDKKTLPSWDQI